MFSSGARKSMDGQEIFRTGNLTQLATPTDRVGLTARQVLEHCARTAVAAVSSLLVARLFGLPEIYWAPVTTLVITQSSLAPRSPFPGSVSLERCLERWSERFL